MRTKFWISGQHQLHQKTKVYNIKQYQAADTICEIGTWYIDHQGHCFSAANFTKFRGAICEIPQHHYPKVPYILRPVHPVGVVVLTDNSSKYKEFIVTSNTKTHYIIFVHINIIQAHHVIHVITLILS